MTRSRARRPPGALFIWGLLALLVALLWLRLPHQPALLAWGWWATAEAD